MTARTETGAGSSTDAAKRSASLSLLRIVSWYTALSICFFTMAAPVPLPRCVPNAEPPLRNSHDSMPSEPTTRTLPAVFCISMRVRVGASLPDTASYPVAAKVSYRRTRNKILPYLFER